MNRLRVLPLAAAVLVLAGCVHPIKDAGSGGPAEAREAVDPGALEVRCFKGGYGIDFFEKAAREYEEAHPGVKIDLAGDPRVWEQLRPRFIAGNPPGLAFPGWGMDLYALIYEHQALPLDDALLTTPYGESTGTWKDTFITEILKLGQYQGHTYLLPYQMSLNGWWYNVGLFEQHGWKPPTTYDELLALCEKIKAAGIAPLTYQGKYPYYAFQGFILPWAISVGGVQSYLDAELLKPGAWKSSAFLTAAKMLDEMRLKGNFQKGADGMSHTEAQMEFLQGHAAMIPCGTWLDSEMKNQMPPGFRMQFFLPPIVKDGKGDPTTLQVSVEPWMVPSHGRNSALAIDYYKYLTSKKKAHQFVMEKGTVSSVRDANEGELPPTLRAPAEALKRAKVTWTTRYTKWYPSLEDTCRTEMAKLLQGSQTPQGFCDQIEAGAEKVRRDPNIPKHDE